MFDQDEMIYGAAVHAFGGILSTGRTSKETAATEALDFAEELVRQHVARCDVRDKAEEAAYAADRAARAERAAAAIALVPEQQEQSEPTAAEMQPAEAQPEPAVETTEATAEIANADAAN